MTDLSKLPVLILAYNRYDKFLRCIKTLHSQGVSNIFVSIDGPKNYLDIRSQELIKEFCNKNNLGMGNIKLNLLEKNYGCRLGPIYGITWFFNNNDYGVVLEDDVILSKNCLYGFADLLIKHKNSSQFMSLSSFNEYCSNQIKRTYSIPVWRSWGWASWSDKWKEHLNFSEEIKKYNLIKLNNLLPKELRSIDTVNILKSCQLNLLDAWDYEFNFTHVAKNYSSLTFGGINNFVYGFDESATHTLDIGKMGIDFSSFRENKIDYSKNIELDLESSKFILKKCGFVFKYKKGLIHFLNTYVKFIFFSILFKLRIIKRIIYRIMR